jgi:hypothetical protein
MPFFGAPVHGRCAGDVGQAAHDRPIGRVDPGCANSNQYIVLTDSRPVDGPELQDVG